MANTVHVHVLQDGPKYLIFNYTNEYVDTALSGTNVVDLSGTSHTAVAAGGQTSIAQGHGAVTSLTLCEVYWSIAGYDQVELFTDHTDDQNHIYMSAGNGYVDYQPYGGLPDAGSGGAGDWQITSDGGGAVGDSVSLTLKFKKVYAS